MPRTRPASAALIVASLLSAPAWAQPEGTVEWRSLRTAAATMQQPQPPGPPMKLAEGHDLRVYDLRDLAAILPQQQDGVPAADSLVATLAGSLGVEHRRLLDGVYAVAAPADVHAMLQENLERLRVLHGESYTLTVAAYAADGAGVPAIGAAAPAADAPPIARLSASVARRSPVALHSTREVSYIADWTPVVGDSAVGYDALTSRETEGIRVVATVGAGPDAGSAGGGELLQLSGALQRVELKPASAPALSAAGTAHDATLPISLPNIDTRQIRADLRIPVGQPTVVAVLDGFEPGKAIIVTATVTKPAPAPAPAPPQPRR